MCNNYEYKKNILKESNKIWIDTCTLMYNDRITIFIRETKDIFKSLKKKITIHGMVMSELYKFSDCNNFVKKNLQIMLYHLLTIIMIFLKLIMN